MTPPLVPYVCKTGMKAWWQLTNWDRVTHICVSKLVIIGSDNGLSPGRRQAITCTNVGILLIQLNSNIFSIENVCELAAILSRAQWVNSKWRGRVADACVHRTGNKQNPPWLTQLPSGCGAFREGGAICLWCDSVVVLINYCGFRYWRVTCMMSISDGRAE